MTMVCRLLVVLLFFFSSKAYAQQTDSVRIDTIRGNVSIAYPAGEANILPDYENNKSELDGLNAKLQSLLRDTTATLQQINIHGYGSPDGPFVKNEKLARQRTDSLVAYVVRTAALPQQKIVTDSTAEDWDGLVRFIENASTAELPHRDNLLRIVQSNRTPDAKEWVMKTTYRDDYRYIVLNCLPSLRRSNFQIEYILIHSIPKPQPVVVAEPVAETPAQPVADVVSQPTKGIPFMALRTNLLYDAALIPNIGVEVNLGKQWTIGADWLYTRFSSDKRHRYWQGYGGYLTVRKYFGGNKHQTSDIRHQTSLPFTGHHLGIYGLGMTYDVEWGGRGYQAARFGFGGGVEYGYSARIGRRLCLDFNLGLGFQDGEYKEYLPTDDGTGHYVWQSTHKRHWWGPTKAEVTLKWILGPLREKKGGAR